ncbi:MAG TPA: FHA domain-containing protein, partial [Gemmatimonadaceae bacterium]|nr:FHA domain-containing protein [Gemmatimonadaceae bacterium]
MPFLEHEGNTRELTAGDTLVGSGSQADWRLQNVDLAARHFSVVVGSDGRVLLKPYSAQNVVVVNGRQVPLAGVSLADGDVIAAGLTRFAFVA